MAKHIDEPTEVRATEALYIGRARAANAGDLVPASHVEKYGWEGKVEPVSMAAPPVVDEPITIDQILAVVGTDPAAAQAALDAELEAKGDKPRKSLVEKLQAVVEAADNLTTLE